MKKKSLLPGILIILVGFILMGSILFYSYLSHKNTPVYFNPNKKSAAKILYDSVMGIDMDSNYPRSPDEVMRVYLDINRLIYGDMIVDESLYGNIVTQLRRLFGPELIEKNDYETQLDTILEGISLLKELGIYQLSYEQLPVIFNTVNTNEAYVRAVQTYSNNEGFYWEFQLERVLPENNWKIIRFDRTDENFNPVSWD